MAIRVGRAALALLMITLSGCGSDTKPDDTPPNVLLDASAEPDAGHPQTRDASVLIDASSSDAGMPSSDAADRQDAQGGVTDAAIMDAAIGGDAGQDAALIDAAITDATVIDGAIMDAAIGGDALPPLDTLPWPQAQPVLSPCTPSGLSFEPPVLSHSGPIAIAFSAALQPRNVIERVEVTVLTPDDEPDGDYNGDLVWSLASGAELVSSTPVVAGKAEATLRFTSTGVVRVQAGLDGDPRTGYSEVLVYTPQLPIWELDVDDADLDRIVSNPDNSEIINATLSIDGKPHPTLMRLHGGSSRDYPKKSFRFDLLDPADGTWGTHLILRAEYNDKSMLRNWLSMQMFNSSTWLPAPHAQLVHFRVNGQYYGVMDNVERIDGPFLKARGLSETASVYESDPPDDLAMVGNLTVLSDSSQYRRVYARQRGMLDYQDLIKLIEQTLVTPDADFERVAKHEIEIDDYLVYLAMMASIQNQDNVRKNFYLYRDSQAMPDSKWMVFPWDLDLTFGHLWSEENDVFEEDVVADSDIFVGVHVPARGGFFNQMVDRVLRTASFRARFRAMLAKIMASYLTRANTERLIDNVLCRATPDLAADTHKRATNSEYLDRVAEIYDYIDERAAYVQSVQDPTF